jgi:glutaredoxin 3
MIGVEWTREQLLESIPQARTVPQIILNGEYIGGYDQLKAYFNQGKNE